MSIAGVQMKMTSKRSMSMKDNLIKKLRSGPLIVMMPINAKPRRTLDQISSKRRSLTDQSASKSSRTPSRNKPPKDLKESHRTRFLNDKANVDIFP